MRGDETKPMTLGNRMLRQTRGNMGALLLVVTAISLFVHYIAASLCILLCAVYAAVGMIRGRTFDWRLHGAAAVFLLCGFIGAVAAQNALGAVGVLGAAAVFLAAFLASETVDEPLFLLLLDLLCLSSLFGFAVALIQKCVPIADFFRNRPTSTFLNTNYYAAAAEMMVLLALYRFLSATKGRLFYGFILLINLTGVYFSNCRSSWAPIFVGVLILLLFFKRYKTMLACAAVFMLVGYFAFEMHRFLPRMESLNSSAFQVRAEIWQGSLHAFLKRPLFGYGPFGYYYAARAGIVPVQEYHAHNMLLELFISYGVPGAAALFVFVAQRLHCAARRAKQTGSRQYFGFAVAVTAAVLIHGVTDYTLFWPQTAMLFFLLLGRTGEADAVLKQKTIPAGNRAAGESGWAE